MQQCAGVDAWRQSSRSSLAWPAASDLPTGYPLAQGGVCEVVLLQCEFRRPRLKARTQPEPEPDLHIRGEIAREYRVDFILLDFSELWQLGLPRRQRPKEPRVLVSRSAQAHASCYNITNRPEHRKIFPPHDLPSSPEGDSIKGGCKAEQACLLVSRPNGFIFGVEHESHSRTSTQEEVPRPSVSSSIRIG